MLIARVIDEKKKKKYVNMTGFLESIQIVKNLASLSFIQLIIGPCRNSVFHFLFFPNHAKIAYIFP